MRHLNALTTLTLALVFGLGSHAVQARDLEASHLPTSDDIGFLGSPAELVGYTVQRLLEQEGHVVRPATHQQVGAVRKAFGPHGDFQWENTWLLSSHGQAFTVTLPATLEGLWQGTVALGVLEHGEVTRVLALSLVPDGPDSYAITLTRPDGSLEARVSLGTNAQGAWLMTPSDLLQLAVVLYPNAAKGVFDPIIETLQGILNMLYEIRDIINMAICIVDEMIEMFENLNYCGWGETKPGGGAIAGVIVCTVQDVIEFLSQMTDHCL